MNARALLLAVAVCLLACGDDLTAPDIVARVAAEEIRLANFEGYLKESSIQLDAGLDATVLTQLFDEFLDERLLLVMATDEGMATESTGRREALEALIAASLENELSDERVLLYYRQHADQFERPERVRLSQILVDELATAELAIASLAGGERFSDVAKRLSIEPTAAMGGDQGFLGRADLPPTFAEAIFGLEVGVPSDIVRADYGYHIFLITERRAAESVPLADVDAEIRSELRSGDAHELRQRLVQEARSRYNPRVYASNLPFDYQGLHTSG